MRYSHPSIFSSLSDVPISLKHSKKNSNPILLFQQQTRPTSSIFPILVFFFFLLLLFVTNSNPCKMIEKPKTKIERRGSWEIEMVRRWPSESESERYKATAIMGVVQRIIGCGSSLELQVQLSLSLSLLLSPSSFPLSVPLLESNWNFLYIWDKKRCQLNKYYTNLLFCPFLLNQFGFWKLI